MTWSCPKSSGFRNLNPKFFYSSWCETWIFWTQTLLVLGPTTYNGWWIPSHRPGTTDPRLKTCLVIPTAHVSSAPLTDQTKAEWLCFTWGFTAKQRWIFTVDTTLEGSQALPHNNRLLFLTFILSSCSHKSQLSHISCGFLACLSTVAKFKACYHSPADTEIHGTTRKIKCPNNDKDLTNLQKQKTEVEKLSFHFLKAPNTPHMTDLSHHGKQKQIYFCFSRVRMLLGIRPEPKLLLTDEGARLEKLPVDLKKFFRYSTKRRWIHYNAKNVIFTTGKGHVF